MVETHILVAILFVVGPQRTEVILICFAAELEPALLLNKGDKHQAVEQPLREEPLTGFISDSADQSFDSFEHGLVLFVEGLRNRLDIEGLIVALLNDEGGESEQVRAYGCEVEFRDDLTGCLLYTSRCV